MLNHFKKFALLILFIGVGFAGCATQATQQPTSLQVTRMNKQNPNQPIVGTWTITDARSVQQLYQEAQNLPRHQNNGADSCAESHYSYTLTFFAGTTSLQKDELYNYCLTLILEDGSYRDPSASFTSQLASMLHLTTTGLAGW